MRPRQRTAQDTPDVDRQLDIRTRGRGNSLDAVQIATQHVRVRPPERTWAGGGQTCLDRPAGECAAAERELAPCTRQLPAHRPPVAQAPRRGEADLRQGTMRFEDAVLNMRFDRDRVGGRRSIPERALAIHGLTRRTSVSLIVVRGRRRRESSRQRRSSMSSTCASVTPRRWTAVNARMSYNHSRIDTAHEPSPIVARGRRWRESSRQRRPSIDHCIAPYVELPSSGGECTSFHLAGSSAGRSTIRMRRAIRGSTSERYWTGSTPASRQHARRV